MGYKLTKGLDCYEERRKKMKFGWTKDLKFYDNTKEENFWVSHELKSWNVMKNEEKQWGLTELKIWNCMNIHRKNQGFWAN